uniref:Uncharacterized protein n=1 Tax=Arundo donax TaxID=35708 RepID=A0A0A8Z489_ARUDO
MDASLLPSTLNKFSRE